MNTLKISAQMVKANPMADRGMSVGFHTKELTAEEKLSVMQYFNQTGWLMFSPDELQEKDIPKQNSEFEGKTPSQRLYSVLFVYWKQLGGEGDFNDFYKQKMEGFIDFVKGKLDQ